jgi:hypothetical protein
MYKRGRVLFAVLFGVFVVAVAAGGAVAATALTAGEMGTMEGGCNTYCLSQPCGYTMSCSGMCDEYPYQCNPYEQIPQQITNCIASTGTTPCTRGALTNCGTWWACFCYHGIEGYRCMIVPNGSHGNQGLYYSGCEQP